MPRGQDAENQLDRIQKIFKFSLFLATCVAFAWIGYVFALRGIRMLVRILLCHEPTRFRASMADVGLLLTHSITCDSDSITPTYDITILPRVLAN